MVLATLPERKVCDAADGLDLPVVPNPSWLILIALLGCWKRELILIPQPLGAGQEPIGSRFGSCANTNLSRAPEEDEGDESYLP